LVAREQIVAGELKEDKEGCATKTREADASLVFYEQSNEY
jgi:hypothetical protein